MSKDLTKYDISIERHNGRNIEKNLIIYNIYNMYIRIEILSIYYQI